MRGKGAVLLAFSLASLISLGGAQTFGDPATGPLPNVTELNVYDVTDAEDRRYGGELVAEAVLNSSFSLKFEEYSLYRFEFNIANNGSSEWNISGSDTLRHSGLNDTWNVEDIFYTISDTRSGGRFSSGTLNWNTSEEGSLETSGENSTMKASYVINVSGMSSDYNLTFQVSDASSNSGSRDSHNLSVKNLGVLNVSIIGPPNDTVLQSNKSFDISGRVQCLEGVCGGVNLSARYNDSGSSAETLIPRNSGTPFHTLGANTFPLNTLEDCSSYLGREESCDVDISVNSTGRLDTEHLLDVNASSNITEVESNDSEDRLVTIRSIILMDLSWGTTQFEPAGPGSEEVPAMGNDDFKYNITITEQSNSADNLFARATPLTSEANPSYAIEPGNITLSLDQNPSEEDTRLSESFREIDVGRDLDPGSLIQTFFFLNVPPGIAAGDYNGTMMFKANNS